MELSPSGSRWIDKYFSLLENEEITMSIKNPKGFDSEEVIFGTCASTGIVYGIPAHFIGLEDGISKKWTKEEKLKVILFESLLVVYKANVGAEQTKADYFLKVLYEFYKAWGIKKYSSILKSITGQSQSEKVEAILAKRASIPLKLNHKLWLNYQSNSLVFADVILFHHYLKTQPSADELQESKDHLYGAILKVIASSIHSDGEQTQSEANIFKTYLASAGFSDEEDDFYKKYFNHKLPLESIDELNEINSWIAKRYVLETSILTMWSDQLIAQSEREFLEQLSEKLEMNHKDLESCMMFIETFVLQHYEQFPFFCDSKSYTKIYNNLSSRFVKLLSRNKDKLAKEMLESKDLVQLISKSTHTELDAEEKKRVKSQFLDIIKTIPALAIFLLPGGAVLLPIVLKIVPTLIPSAFQQNKIEDDGKKG